MSYALVFAGDARPDFHALDSWLQEEVLDELEILAAGPSILPAVSPGGDAVYTFTRPSAGTRHHIAITLGRSDSTKTLTILGIALKKSALPPTA